MQCCVLCIYAHSIAHQTTGPLTRLLTRSLCPLSRSLRHRNQATTIPYTQPHTQSNIQTTIVAGILMRQQLYKLQSKTSMKEKKNSKLSFSFPAFTRVVSLFFFPPRSSSSSLDSNVRIKRWRYVFSTFFFVDSFFFLFGFLFFFSIFQIIPLYFFQRLKQQ